MKRKNMVRKNQESGSQFGRRNVLFLEFTRSGIVNPYQWTIVGTLEPHSLLPRKFHKNDHGVYGTDDRGTVYVKYGPSTFKRSGLLSPSNAEIRSKLYDLASFKGGIDSRELFNLNMSIKQQYIPKYYEVWVYRNLGLKQPLLFIFGESANRGTFGLRKSLEDFIPNGSFNMGISSSWRYDTGPRGLTAGPFFADGSIWPALNYRYLFWQTADHLRR